ncbi:MAG TPA: VOC family protein [Pyrinomonadaceae bacterium]|nr:VOC family protein [Pyrinomonadaceae bacterium]HMP66506.1 VOC family protein [Pyrinomonadaceae bacterium]
MVKKVGPMIHVPDVQKTVDWYKDIGFTVTDSFDDEGELNWAMLSLGTSELMFNAGGRSSSSDRREVDLYVYVENIDDLYIQLKERAEVVGEIDNTFYGMREFIIRDPNRFWVTFGQEAPSRQTNQPAG